LNPAGREFPSPNLVQFSGADHSRRDQRSGTASLAFLEVLNAVQPPGGDGRIGKDDIRILSRANFERRIEELKQDSDQAEQGTLIRGVYVIRQFCVVEKKTNIVLVSEATLQQNDRIRALLYRLLDYSTTELFIVREPH
jgi:hypothetical protein